MSNSMPCFTDSDSNRLPEEGHETPLPKYRNNTYRAAIEDHRSGVDVSGLCRMWEGWRDSDKLIWILHGFLMITPLGFPLEAWNEISFLEDMLVAEK